MCFAFHPEPRPVSCYTPRGLNVAASSVQHKLIFGNVRGSSTDAAAVKYLLQKLFHRAGHQQSASLTSSHQSPPCLWSNEDTSQSGQEVTCSGASSLCLFTAQAPRSNRRAPALAEPRARSQKYIMGKKKRRAAARGS